MQVVPTIVHRTPGLLDLKSITTLGLSAKPNSDNPIGMFGTGLKLALATLVRMGAEPVIWIGKEKYTFATKTGKFRGQEYQGIRMRKESDKILKPRWVDLPFTTEFGKFWEPWMAFRELEANTRDENGETTSCAHIQYWGIEDQTAIIITHEGYALAHHLRDEIFLPNARRQRHSDDPAVQIFEGQSKFLYWRGVRVFDLDKPSKFTYNFVGDLQLTEDRTLKSIYAARLMLAMQIAAATKDPEVIRSVITANANHWEHRLEWPTWVAPSQEFIRIANEEKNNAPGTASYISHYVPKDTRPVSEFEKASKPWRLDDDDNPTAIHASNGKRLFVKPEDFQGDWGELARALVGKINGEDIIPF
jgi:hypothetical protein